MKTLYLNGTIITMEEGTAQAVLEEDGIITAVGEEEALKAMAKGAQGGRPGWKNHASGFY